MLLAVDIGNTSITFGHFSKGRLRKTARISTPGVGMSVKLLKRFPLKKIQDNGSLNFQ